MPRPKVTQKNNAREQLLGAILLVLQYTEDPSGSDPVPPMLARRLARCANEYVRLTSTEKQLMSSHRAVRLDGLGLW